MYRYCKTVARLHEIQRSIEFLIDAKFDLEHSAVEREYGHAHLVANTRFPAIRKALLRQERVKVVHASTKGGQQRGRAARGQCQGDQSVGKRW